MPLYSVFLGFAIVKDTYKEDAAEFFHFLPACVPAPLDVQEVRLRSAVDVELLMFAETDAQLRDWLNAQSTLKMQDYWNVFTSARDQPVSQLPLFLYSRAFLEN